MAVFARTLLMYFLLILTMRLMGKRQLGELEISELVTTFLLSEIASMPISGGVPLSHAAVALVTVFAASMGLSFFLLKCPRFKSLASARPSVLIARGKINQAEMRHIRITPDELISEIRGAGLSSPAQVDYAILEQNGKISVIPKNPPPPICGVMHILIGDGAIDEHNLTLLHLSKEDLRQLLEEKGLAQKDVFLLGMDDGGHLFWEQKEPLAK